MIKSARSGKSESSGNLNVNDKRRSSVSYRKVDDIPGIYIPRKLERFELGGSETQLCSLEN